MFDFMTILRALGEDNRIRILMALRGRELCVCQITGLLGLAPSTTSRHLSILRQARLIDSRKKGKWVYYYLPDVSFLATQGEPETMPVLAAKAVKWVENSLLKAPEILADEKRIEEILRAKRECFGLEGLAEEDLHSPEIHSLVETLLDKEDGQSQNRFGPE